MKRAMQVLEGTLCMVLGRVTEAEHANDGSEDDQNHSAATRLAHKWLHVYVAQEFNWDCGVACCRMVQKWYHGRMAILKGTPVDEVTMLRANPLWTIEIFALLREAGVKSSMHTLTLGISEHHQHYEWYTRYMENDIERVNKCFKFVEEKGYHVIQESLTLDDIKHRLLDPHECIAVVLVDNICLKEWRVTANYMGHYIVVLVYDSNDDTFLYLNPADGPRGEINRIDSEILDAARRHPGTDEDIVFCYRY